MCIRDSSSFLKPLDGFLIALWNTVTISISTAKIVLGSCIPSVSSFLKQLYGFLIILRSVSYTHLDVYKRQR